MTIEIRYQGQHDTYLPAPGAVDDYLAARVAQGHDRGDYAVGDPYPFVLRCGGGVVGTFADRAAAEAVRDARIAAILTAPSRLLQRLAPTDRDREARVRAGWTLTGPGDSDPPPADPAEMAEAVHPTTVPAHAWDPPEGVVRSLAWNAAHRESLAQALHGKLMASDAANDLLDRGIIDEQGELTEDGLAWVDHFGIV